MDVNWTYSKLTLTEDHLLSKHICLKVHLEARQCVRACARALSSSSRETFRKPSQPITPSQQ